MSDTTVTILGAGALGGAMADHLGACGTTVRIWNRHADKARAVADRAEHVTAVEQAADAVAGADVVLTVLRDEDAVTEVIEPLLDGMDDAVWVQAGTIGPDAAGRLADLAAQHDVAYLDAPVSGSTEPAEHGKLVWLVAGSSDAVERARPVLETLGSDVQVVGQRNEGSALKLAVNAWMTGATVLMSDTLALCDDLGLAHDALRDALGAGALAMPYALQKSELMDSGEFDPGFAVQLALKDLHLAGEKSRLSDVLADVTARLEQAVDDGSGGQDLAAVSRVARTSPQH